MVVSTERAPRHGMDRTSWRASCTVINRHEAKGAPTIGRPPVAMQKYAHWVSLRWVQSTMMIKVRQDDVALFLAESEDVYDAVDSGKVAAM